MCRNFNGVSEAFLSEARSLAHLSLEDRCHVAGNLIALALGGTIWKELLRIRARSSCIFSLGSIANTKLTDSGTCPGMFDHRGDPDVGTFTLTGTAATRGKNDTALFPGRVWG